MNIESLREYCLSKPGVSESCPFGDETLVFKLNGKIFALMPLDAELSMNLKCEPERAVSLREEYPCIIPGWHMNKVHWNTVIIDGSLSDKIIQELIDHSYDLVSLGSRLKKPPSK